MAEPQAAPPSFTWKFAGGIDNQSREYELPDGALRQCINMDVTKGGGLRGRDGLRSLQSGVFHSLFSPSSGAFGLVVYNGSLCRVSVDGGLTALTSVGAGRIAYTEHNGEVYWSQGNLQGRVTASGLASFWGLATPPAPVCTATGDGLVRVAMTARYQGVESGAAGPVSLTGETVTVTAPAAPAGVDFVIYATRPDGTTLRQVATLVGGASTPLNLLNRGRVLESLYATRPPAGSLLASGHGRIWIADGSTLWWTAALSPHWVFRASSFFQFNSAVTLVAPVADGLYVATRHATWFLAGTDPATMAMREVSDCGVVLGTGVTRCPTDVLAGNAPPQPVATWLDSDGVFCLGRAGGQLQRVTQGRFSADVRGIPYGSSVYRANQGIRQFIIGLAEPAVANVTDVAIAATTANGLTGA